MGTKCTINKCGALCELGICQTVDSTHTDKRITKMLEHLASKEILILLLDIMGSVFKSLSPFVEILN